MRRRPPNSILFLLLLIQFLAAYATSSFHAALKLERAFPIDNHKIELSHLRARDRVRHGRRLDSLDGVVDFPVDGIFDPYLVGLYFTRVELGTPPKEFYVQIDTGSDVLWVTCAECDGCPHTSGLNIPLNFYDSRSSSTAYPVSCSDAKCSLGLQSSDSGCSVNTNQCSYSFQYGDGSGTSGYYVSDLVNLMTVVGGSQISNVSASIVFGCSTLQTGDLTKSERAVDGIFGFGQQDMSVISQLASEGVAPRAFSHCLKGNDGGGGILVLGSIVEPTMVYSPLVPSQPHYNLNLQSISVNGQTLSINPAVFSTSGNQGTIIDSGTTLAYLAEEAYDVFVQAISDAVAQSVRPVMNKGNICYKISASINTIFPPVSFNFAGDASMLLRPEDYLLQQNSIGGSPVWCIGFQKIQGQGITILGDLVLKDKIVVYDLAGQRIGWANYDCSTSVNVSTVTSTGQSEYFNTRQMSKGDTLRTTTSLALIFLIHTLLFLLSSQSSIVGFLENKTILVTGATGFVAKVFVEKILRSQPKVKKLFLLLRAKDSASASTRLYDEILSKELFVVLKDKCGSDLSSLITDGVTIPVAGDISIEDLGVKEVELKNAMWNQVDVVVNLAATVNFDERYDVALAINTMGPKHVLNFAKKCVNLKALIHVSTAYVCGEKPGIMVETPFKMGETLNGKCDLDINFEFKVMEETLKQLKEAKLSESAITAAMKDFGNKRAQRFGWPNTYVFTKSMGEMLIGESRENIPLVILRPTIVTSTIKEPFPGWIEGVRTIDSLAIAYGKGRMECFLGDPNSTIDLIPADMVVNSIIVAIAAHADKPGETVYQVGSSNRNPLKYSSIPLWGHIYFSQNPWTGRDGKAVIVSKIKILDTMESFHSYMSLRYILPLKVLKLANIAACHYFERLYTNSKRKIDSVTRLVELYRPYLFFKAIFEDKNTDMLRVAARNSMDSADTFYFQFDPKTIDWEDYMMNVHFPGAVKYLFK